MPSTRPRAYTVEINQHIEIELEERGGGRALVVGQVRAVPVATWGDGIMRLRISDARAKALPAKLSAVHPRR
jgi:hypothetical protein